MPAPQARITGITPQLRTTDLEASIRFYVDRLGFALAFRWEDFYAGVCAGDAGIHLKRVDEPDPSIAHVAAGDHVHLYIHVDDVDALHAQLRERAVPVLAGPVDRPWNTRELVLRDDQGHTLHFSQPLTTKEPAR